MPRPVIGICAIFKNEELYIEEWIAFHILQGVGCFRLYDNESTDQTAVLGRQFRHLVDIEIIPWPQAKQDFSGLQQAGFLDGMNRLKGRCTWVATIDIDEFIFSPGGDLPQAFESLKAEIGAVAVQQIVFGSAGKADYTPELVTTRFDRCGESSGCHWFKTASRPECVQRFDSAHSVVLERGSYAYTDGEDLVRSPEHPGCAASVVNGPIRLHHYILKSFGEFRQKQMRWARQETHAERYKDSYFVEQDKYLGQLVNSDLVGFSSRIKELIARVKYIAGAAV